MPVDTDAEILRLRAAVRDLAALAAIPAVWTGKEPVDVATGLAEELVGLLQLDFAFVRLCDPDGAGAVEVTRGYAWKGFHEWLESRLAMSPVPRKEIVADVGGGSEPCRGFVIPIGFDGEGGVLAAACGRADFPAEIEQLLLSLAANQAATAFQNARLIQERRRAEEQLHEARDQLEAKVAGRTAELRRSEVNLAELVEEQGALRRVATLVAQDVVPDELFAAVAREVGTLFGADYTGMIRYEPDPAFVTTIATWAAVGEHPSVPSSFRTVPGDPTAMVAETRKPARVDDWTDVPGPIAELIRRDLGVMSSVGSPIVVEGSLWGALAVHSKRGPLPPDTESRLLSFTELVATAIANTSSRAEVSRLADEQAALRRVATLVASGLGPEAVFAAVAHEVQALFDADISAVARFEKGGMVTVMADLGGPNTAGARVALDPAYVVWSVRETGHAARFDTDDPTAADLPGLVQANRIRSGIASPVVVNGQLWGAVTAATSGVDPMPADAESRMAQFTKLVAAAVSNVQARTEVERLAAEQAALRRVATLVARESSPEEVFAQVAEEVGLLLEADTAGLCRYERDEHATLVAAWGRLGRTLSVGSRFALDDDNVTALVYRTRRPARFDAYDDATGPVAEYALEVGLRSACGTPIFVGGRMWGAIVVASSHREAMIAEAESRMEEFTELVATAISNIEARSEVEELAEEQAALRRVATLVAEGVEPAELFSAVTQEVARLFLDDEASVVPSIIRFDPGPEFVLVGAAKPMLELPIGSRWGPKDLYVSTRVLRTGRSARVEEKDVASQSGGDADLLRRQGFLYQVGSPIIVEGRLWGTMTMNSGAALPPDTGERLESFTELVATAIANAESRGALRQLADEQAALRRVAELVAREASHTEIFTAIAGEIGQLLGSDEMRMMRYEGGREAVVVARAGEREIFAVGSRWPLEGDNVASRVFRTGQPARIDDYQTKSGPIAEGVRSVGIRGVVGTPILVQGQVWGAMLTSTVSDEPLPPDTECRLGQFTELMATAIANADSRAEVERLAAEQAALRRVATLVAQGAPPSAVLDAVAGEMQRLLDADAVTIGRYEAGDEMTVVAHRSPEPSLLGIGTRVGHEGQNVTAMVRGTEQPVRLEDLGQAHGGFAELFRRLGMRAVVGTPIVVDGRLWGTILGSWNREEAPPVETEEGMAQFAALLDTAIANADSRDQLTASGARLVTEADEARRRVVRDLHDGAQQRLVHTIVTLKLAQRAIQANDDKAEPLITEALEHAQQGNAELRELAQGLLPAVLTQGGLRAGVNTIVSRVDLPVEVDIPAERFPEEIEASAYFVVAEALTNVMKHSRARRAEVRASVEDGMLQVEVRDDGVGGADPSGHGLVGLGDRVTAIGGQLMVESPADGGTLLAAKLPASVG